MSLYISDKNEYPRYIGDLQLQYPDFELGDVLPSGWKEVKTTEAPIANESEVVYEEDPKEIAGVMTQQWGKRTLTAEEIERKTAPATAKAKLIALGLTEVEISALARGLVR